MKKFYSITLALFCLLNVQAKQDVKLTINHLLGKNKFAFNTESQNDLTNKFNLTRFEYYLSGISITHDGGQITKAADVYILVRANQNDTILLGNFDITKVEAISFVVGVDPKVNNGDPTLWPSNHPLSPKAPSMHWGWSAGYRFVAIEGKSGSSLNQEFQIHALGNINYFNQSIPTDASQVNGSLVIAINADYNKALSGIDISSGLVEHSESNEAAECLRNFQTKVFTNLSGAGSVLSVNDVQTKKDFVIYPNPANRVISITATDNKFENANIVVTDIFGKVVINTKLDALTGSVSIEKSGTYFITITKNGVINRNKIIIY